MQNEALVGLFFYPYFKKAMLESPITFDRFARYLIVGTLIAVSFYFLYLLEGALFPFFVALLLAYFLHPLVSFFQYKMRMKNRVLAIFLTFVLVALLFWGVYELVVPPVFEELGKVNKLIAAYLGEKGDSQVSLIPAALNRFVNKYVDFEQLSSYLTKENIMGIGEAIIPRLQKILSQSFSLLGTVGTALLVLLYTFFILLDYEALTSGWIPLLPARHRNRVARLVNDVKNSMNRYFRGQSLIAFIVAVLTSLGFLLIDLPMAIAMGLFVGVLTLIPYMKVIALFPTILLTLMKSVYTGESFWLLLFYLFLVFATVQVLEDMLLVPKIMGRITGLNPAIILLSLSVWGTLLGVTGMVIALPVTSLLLAYYRRYRIARDGLEADDAGDLLAPAAEPVAEPSEAAPRKEGDGSVASSGKDSQSGGRLR